MMMMMIIVKYGLLCTKIGSCKIDPFARAGNK